MSFQSLRIAAVRGSTRFLVFAMIRVATQSLLRREHADAARVGQSKNGLSKNKACFNEKRTIRTTANRSFLSYRLRSFLNTASRTVQDCPHAGRAVPSGTPSDQRETNDLHNGRIVRFSLLSPSQFLNTASRTVRNCPHAGRAVASATPSEWYYFE